MWAATAWDDADWEGARARGWTVMGTLRERQRRQRNEALAARRRLSERHGQFQLMTAASAQRDYEDSIKARWRGGPTVLAFLFAHPDSDAIRMLDQRGEYFDCRTGDTWDLSFPGYYRSGKGRLFELEAGARPVGHGYADDWYFNPHDFDLLRGHVERSSQGRWQYSGGTDLVLINGWLVEGNDPSIDWASTVSGQVADQAAGARTLTLANVIERVSRDLESATEDASYGVGELTEPPSPSDGHIERDLMVNALAGIAAALGARALGI